MAGDGTEPTADATACARCAHLHGNAKTDGWYRWMCTRAPLPQVYNPVTGATVADPPFRFCRQVNYGDCGEYEQGPNTLNPKG